MEIGLNKLLIFSILYMQHFLSYNKTVTYTILNVMLSLKTKTKTHHHQTLHID